MVGLDVRPMTEDDREVAFPIYMEAFGGGPEDLASIVDLPVADRWVLTDEGTIVGALRLLRFGHYLGGRSVPAAGIAAVAISPRARGKGAGVTLMREVLRESAADGLPLSTLFMSTMAPYRSVGYEISGVRNRYRAPLSTVTRGSTADVETWDDDNLGEIVDCHRRFAQTQNGIMDRTDEWWHKRVFRPLGANEFLYRYLVRDQQGVVRGYAVYTHHQETGHFPDNWVPGDSAVIGLATRDLVWETREAASALLNLAAGHWSSGTNLYWSGPAADPLLTLFKDRLPVVDSAYTWMARLSDVAGCLTARGYHAEADVAVEFRVVDATLPDNEGCYRLEVSGGKAAVERIDDAKTTVTVGGLAAMYTSSLHPYDAKRAGFLEPGSDKDVESLAAAFAGPSPWLIEFF